MIISLKLENQLFERGKRYNNLLFRSMVFQSLKAAEILEKKIFPQK